ncbi:MAG TPA: hypothetical protein VK907_07245, partial [Phnomibacter sp.]|nr:hypothetical protein [Phnomibacter sp.]
MQLAVSSWQLAIGNKAIGNNDRHQRRERWLLVHTLPTDPANSTTSTHPKYYFFIINKEKCITIIWCCRCIFTKNPISA